jgi:hypothetical protein
MGAAHISPPTLPLLGLLIALGSVPAAADGGPGRGVHERLLAAEQAACSGGLGRPEAIAPLAAILAMEDDLPPRASRSCCAGWPLSKKLDPLVAAHVEYRLALLESRRGRGEAAGPRRYRGLGLIFDGQVVGPVRRPGAGRGRAGLSARGVRRRPAPDRHFAGKEREVSWREVADVRREGALALDGLLRPDSDAVAYLLTYVQSDRRRPAVLRLGSAGPIKAWVGGRVVLEKNVVREARLTRTPPR